MAGAGGVQIVPKCTVPRGRVTCQTTFSRLLVHRAPQPGDRNGGAALGGSRGSPQTPRQKFTRAPRGRGSPAPAAGGLLVTPGRAPLLPGGCLGRVWGVLLRLWGRGWAVQHPQKVASCSLNRAVSEWAALPCPHQHLFQVCQRLPHKMFICQRRQGLCYRPALRRSVKITSFPKGK